MKCLVCEIEFTTDKAKTCSPRCRTILSRRRSVTANGAVTEPVKASVTFEFITVTKDGLKSEKRQAKYWYDVPIAAVPAYKKDWPKMPQYMNGRQYFLWWKNDFKVGNSDGPILWNPNRRVIMN